MLHLFTELFEKLVPICHFHQKTSRIEATVARDAGTAPRFDLTWEIEDLTLGTFVGGLKRLSQQVSEENSPLTILVSSI